MKTNFEPFKVGTVFNPIKKNFSNIKLVRDTIRISFPSRLNAMALDPSKITNNNNLVYSPGEVIFEIKIYKDILIKVTNKKGEIALSERSSRQPLIRHAVIIMRRALGVNDGFYIDVKNSENLKHCGLGSSSGLIAGVAVSINELYGNLIEPDLLSKYVAQNHGEEINRDEDHLMPVQCIGGSAVGGYFDGGMKVISGETCLIKSMDIPKDYRAIIGIPRDYKARDSKEMMDLEIDNFKDFLNTGLKFKEKIAYNVLHYMLPAMTAVDLKTIGDVIFDYRYNMGSIKNCSFGYPGLVELTNKLTPLKKFGIADLLAISSVGPGVFAITKKPDICTKEFKKNNLFTKIVKIENEKYKTKNEKLQ